ncbi:MAG: M1 family metallopeptidase [Gemmatimonadota bacterium]
MSNAKSEAYRGSLPFRSLRCALACALALAATARPGWGQEVREPLPETNQALFSPLQLPPPDQVRTATGQPGPAYWQQRADYSIHVSLDPDTHRLRGSETIRYTNNSPDDLEDLWLQLDQNLFRPGSRGAVVNSSTRWRGSFQDGGDRLERVELLADGARRPARYAVEDTRMHIRLDRPLRARGGRIDIEINWSFVVPEYGADRMGRFKGKDGWVYELAQWYPRMYVYDDVSGWNPLPYLGQGEFYLEYGDFQVEITVPRDFQVVATGRLVNPEEVLTARQRERLREARHSAETVAIVRPEEVGAKRSRPAGRGPLTWRYRAESVRDFAWAASKAFILDATSWQDVLIMSAYPKEALGPDKDGKPGWEQATRFARHTISYYSDRWYRYPYPVAINVAGAVGGMEYPMIVFCSVRARGQGLFGVTDHEFGHSWFPMIVGSDERRYAWMDEGFNTFLNHYSNLAYFGSEAARAQRTNPDFIARRMQEPISDQPIMTWPDLLRRQGLGFMGYRKPGFGLILLREVILGPERFDRAFRAYIRHWAFKHPQPADFFRSMEESTGEDLDWFWRGWFYRTDLLDQAVDGVAVKDGHTEIRLSNREGLVMPAELEIRMGDGSSVHRTLPVEVWMTSDIFTLNLAGTPNVVAVTIDPQHRLPDVRRGNNRWKAAPAAAGGGG